MVEKKKKTTTERRCANVEEVHHTPQCIRRRSIPPPSSYSSTHLPRIAWIAFFCVTFSRCKTDRLVSFSSIYTCSSYYMRILLCLRSTISFVSSLLRYRSIEDRRNDGAISRSREKNISIRAYLFQIYFKTSLGLNGNQVK